MEIEIENLYLKPADRAKRILFALGRLTVLRGLLHTKPVAHLMSYCDAIAAGDALSATYQFHIMTSALLELNTRRVTGDIWKDFLFSELLEQHNRFSVLSAEKRIDPPVLQAMENDLSLMKELFELCDDDLKNWVDGISKKKSEKPVGKTKKVPQPDENIAIMALSAWAGSEFISERKKPAKPAAEIKTPDADLPQDLELQNWVRWNYDSPGEETTYVADEALAIIYRRFLSEDDWSRLAQPLCDFHANYGCGEFLRYRIFLSTDDGFVGVDDVKVPEWDQLSGISKQKEKIYANTLRFIHTGQGENMLLYGAEGMGKRALVLALARELPELRLIFLMQSDYASAMETIRTLAKQPFRFIAFIDNVSLNESECRHLSASFAYSISERNAILYATSKTPAEDSSLFGIQVAFETLDFSSFYQLVSDSIRRERAYVAQKTIETECQRWREEFGDLSARAAHLLSQKMIRESMR